MSKPSRRAILRALSELMCFGLRVDSIRIDGKPLTASETLWLEEQRTEQVPIITDREAEAIERLIAPPEAKP